VGSAVPTEEFNKTFGGSDSDVASSVIQTADGGYALGGSTESFGSGSRDAWLIKTDENGDEEFNRTFGGQDFERANSVAQTSDGGFVLAGQTGVVGSKHGSNSWIIKTDSNGNEEFNKTFDESATVNSVVQTSDEGLAFAGTTEEASAWLVKMDEYGNEEFNKTFRMRQAPNRINSVVETSDGGYALGGLTLSTSSSSYDAWLIKTDENGNEEFNKTFGGSDSDEAFSVVQTSDGGYALGVTTRSISSETDAWLIKTDENGNEVFNKTFGGKGSDAVSSVIRTADGGYTLSGSTLSFGSGGDAWLIKTDENGNEVFNKTLGGSAGDTAFSVTQTADGGYALAGLTRSFGTKGDAWLIKLAGRDDNGGNAGIEDIDSSDSDDEGNEPSVDEDGEGLPGFTVVTVLLALTTVISVTVKRRNE